MLISLPKSVGNDMPKKSLKCCIYDRKSINEIIIKPTGFVALGDRWNRKAHCEYV